MAPRARPGALPAARWRALGRWRVSRPWGRGLLAQEAAVREPFLEAGGPAGGRGVVGLAQAEAVSRAGEDVQLGGHPGFLEGQVDAGQALGDVGPVFVAAS